MTPTRARTGPDVVNAAAIIQFVLKSMKASETFRRG
jgi:hypothetical protein